MPRVALCRGLPATSLTLFVPDNLAYVVVRVVVTYSLFDSKREYGVGCGNTSGINLWEAFRQRTPLRSARSQLTLLLLTVSHVFCFDLPLHSTASIEALDG